MSSDNITGRDGYIVSKALAYAIGAIQALPPEKQEWSDMQDMIAILNARVQDPTHMDFLCLRPVEFHTGRRPVLIDEKAAETA